MECDGCGVPLDLEDAFFLEGEDYPYCEDCYDEIEDEIEYEDEDEDE